jgi:hypothetical protein
MSQSAMESYISNAGVPAGNGNTMYMLILPDGINAIDPKGTNTNCQYYGGYHTNYGSGGDGWGFAQRCPPSGMGSKLQELTVAASHEIIEAATDPVPNSPTWTLGPLQGPSSSVWSVFEGEVGDLCVGTQVAEGNYTYQRIWSVTAAKTQADPCIPALATPYYNAGTSKDWYAVAAGGSVQIPVSGFSTGYMSDWVLDAQVTQASASGFTAAVQSSDPLHLGGSTYSGINNGKSATVTVTAPSAGQGEFAVVMLASIAVGSAAEPQHLWPVGVYIQ